MKKKSLLINCLSTAFLGASLLTASCSNGGGSSSPPTSTQPPIGGVANDLFWVSAGDFGGLIGPYLLSSIKNDIFNGQWGTNDDLMESRNAALVNQVESQIAVIQGDVAYSNTALESIIETLANDAINNNNYSVNLATQQISNLNAQALRLISLALNDASAYKQTEDILLLKPRAYSSSAQPPSIPAAVMESITTYLTTHREYAKTILPVFNTTILDNLEVSLSCFPSSACATQLFSGIAVAYNAEMDAQNPAINSFYAVKNFYAAIEVVYLQMAAALTRAYILDQLRYYLFIHINPAGTPAKNSLITAPSIILSQPSLMISGNYDAGVQALQTNYTNQMNQLTSQLQQAKGAVYNKNFSTFADPSGTLNSQCNFSESGIDRIPANIASGITSTVSTAAESYGNSYSWVSSPQASSQYLRLSCQSNFHGESGTLATTVDVIDMCNFIPQNTFPGGNASGYQLQASNGYVGCALGQNFAANINSGDLYNKIGHPWDYLYVANQPTSYDGAINNLNNGPYGYSTGYQWIYFLNHPLEAYVYNGYDGYDDFLEGDQPDIVFYPGTSNGTVYNNNFTWGNGFKWTQNNYSFVSILDNGYDSHYSSLWSYISDGYHSYLLGNQTNDGFYPALICLPSDLNCTQGYFNQSGYGDYPYNTLSGYGLYQSVLFSNGDSLAITQLSNKGDYMVMGYYGGASGPISIEGHNPQVTFGNQAFFTKESN